MNTWLFALVALLVWSLVLLVKYMVTTSKNNATNADSSYQESTQVRNRPDVTYANNQTITFNTTSSGTSSADGYFIEGIYGWAEEYELPSWAEAGELVVDKETDELWIIVCEYVGRDENDKLIGMLQVEHYEIDGFENEFTINEIDPYKGEMK